MAHEEREPRYRVDIRVDCATRDLFVANRMMNISRGGFFIEASLPLLSEVDLVFRLPDSASPILAKGCVVWNCDMRRGSARLIAGSGIRFTDMSPGHRDVLESCLRRLAEHGPPRVAEPATLRGAGPGPS
jgi:Tfp pilus assembly protein PilZ